MGAHMPSANHIEYSPRWIKHRSCTNNLFGVTVSSALEAFKEQCLDQEVLFKSIVKANSEANNNVKEAWPSQLFISTNKMADGRIGEDAFVKLLRRVDSIIDSYIEDHGADFSRRCYYCCKCSM